MESTMAKKAVPSSIDPLKPPTPDNPELTAAIDWLPAEIIDLPKQSNEAAAARKKHDNNGNETKRLQRQIAWAIISRVYPTVAVASLPTATVLRKIGGKQWEAELLARGRNTDPKNPDPTKLKYVKPPSWQTLHRMLGRDPKHK
jgi:hypothetical protein